MQNSGFIVGLGEVLWDVFPNEKRLGGAPANFAYHVSQLGLNGCVVSAVGNDELGQDALTALDNKRVCHQIEKVSYPTGTVQVVVDRQGVPQYKICEEVAWDHIPFSPEIEKVARQTQTVSFGSLAQRNADSRAVIRRFLGALPEKAVKVFDINLRQHYYTSEVITESLALSDILKINEEEVHWVSEMLGLGVCNEMDICSYLLNHYKLDMVILTEGVRGSYVHTSSATSYLPTPEVNVVDTVGAGDSFTAAFIVALLKGKPITEAHRFAVDVSAYVCTQRGAMPLLPASITDRIR